MGKHNAPKGQRGQLPSGAELAETGRGAHRVNRAADDTDPELEPVTEQDTDDNTEGWRI